MVWETQRGRAFAEARRLVSRPSCWGGERGLVMGWYKSCVTDLSLPCTGTSGWVESRGKSQMCFILVSSRPAPCGSQGMLVGFTKLQSGFGSWAGSDGPFQMGQHPWKSVLPQLVISVEVSVVPKSPAFLFSESLRCSVSTTWWRHWLQYRNRPLLPPRAKIWWPVVATAVWN